jgi:hypothetical protein
MKKVSVQLPFESTREQLLEKSTSLVHEIYKDLLGREPLKEDATRFIHRINPDNSSINDIYFDNRKVGSLATTFILDGPKGISLDYEPVE